MASFRGSFRKTPVSVVSHGKRVGTLEWTGTGMELWEEHSCLFSGKHSLPPELSIFPRLAEENSHIPKPQRHMEQL